MNYSHLWRRTRLPFVLVLLGLAGTLLGVAQAAPAVSPAPLAPEGMQLPKWLRSLPSGVCPGAGPNCHRASPALADIDHDGILEVVVATNGGHVMVLKDNGTSAGQIVWDVDIAPLIGMSPNTASISSSPAVADIDHNDGGLLEIAIGFGASWGTHTKGGVLVLEHNGLLKSGWPRYSLINHPNGYPQTIFASPALGDLDNDGDLEIVAAGFDKRVYAWHHNGTLLSGFPADSYLRGRFPTWPNLANSLADSVWSSPALADLNQDGFLDIIIGTDEGNFDSRWGGNANGWSCPYALPPGWSPGYCGGSLYALNRFGQILPGYPKHILETIQSSPAIADMNLDGVPDVAVGTGAFYHVYSPDHPTFGFKVFAWDSGGNPVAGWSGGKNTGGVMNSSPVFGDIAGDSLPEVIMGSNNGLLYAWHLNGATVAGFPMTPRSRSGGTSSFDVGIGFVLADYDSDGKMEIFMNQNDSVTIVDGNGAQITTTNNGSDGRPGYSTSGWMQNTPAIGDVDGDGNLELVVHDSKVVVWDLPGTGTRADWPMFKRDATRTSYYTMPGLLGPVTDAVMLVQNIQDPSLATGVFTIQNMGDATLHWNVNSSGESSPAISFPTSSGTIAGRDQAPVVVNASGIGSLPPGLHPVGQATVTTLNDAGDTAGTAVVDLILMVGTISRTYVPGVRR